MRWLKLLSVIALGVAFVPPAGAQAATRDITVAATRSEKRVALVIGNGAYPTARLRNPVNDARAMAKVLQDSGFEVLAYENLPYRDLRRAILEFGAKLESEGVGLFYYAGHGIQVSGRNYLIPVDAEIASEPEVEVEAVDVASVLARMESAKTRVNIVILDACRNNPFGRSFRSSAQGLALIDAPSGTLLGYATAPGKLARDGEGAQGLYTGELVKAMQMPGLKIEEVFKRVRQAVKQQSGDEQVPWESSSLVGDFVFRWPQGPGAQAQGAAPPAPGEPSGPAPAPPIALVPQPAPAPAEADLQRADEIRRLVEQKLRAGGFNLQVKLSPDRTVTLMGVLATEEKKEEAKRIASSVSGVKEVIDGIFLAPPSSGPKKIR